MYQNLTLVTGLVVQLQTIHQWTKEDFEYEQEVLANFLIGCASLSYAKSCSEVMGIVNQIYKSRGIDKLVSNGWWDGFCRQHPNSTLQAAPCLSQTRYLSSYPSILEQYFDVLETTFTEYDLMHT